MSRLGSYTTIDCPHVRNDEEKNDKLLHEALDFLKKEMSPYFRVRLRWNEHDFGPYPSFEVDWVTESYQEVLNAIDMGDEDESEDAIEMAKRVDEAVQHFDSVETLYNEKYSKYL